MHVTITIRRTAAAGAAGSGLLHLLMLGHHGHHLGWSLAMAAMAIICLPCAGHLWRIASRRSWTTIALMNAAMLGVHLWMLASSGSSTELFTRTDSAGPTVLDTGSAPLVHAHGAATDAGSISSPTGSQAGLLHELLLPLASGLAFTEILLALLGLSLLNRQGPACHARRQKSPAR